MIISHQIRREGYDRLHRAVVEAVGSETVRQVANDGTPNRIAIDITLLGHIRQEIE